jgi:hypothetical protein
MNGGDTSARLQNLRDTVKWVSTSVISIGTAISGAVVLTRLGTVPAQDRVIPVILAATALSAIVAEAALAIWALSARDPSLADLIPELEGLTDTASSNPQEQYAQENKIAKRRRRLARDIAKAAPVAQFKYQTMADLGTELQHRRTKLLEALREADSPSVIGDSWKDAIPKLGEELQSAYADLREVTQGLELVRTQRRVAIAVPLTTLLGALVVAAMIPFVLVTQPQTQNKPVAAPVASAVPVKVQFAIDPAAAKSADGCIPSRNDYAVAVGGNWSRPLLIFTAHKGSGRCMAGSMWIWYPQHQGDVVISPITVKG